MSKEYQDPHGQVSAHLGRLAGEEYAYVTTSGRVTGRPHEIEIWFGSGGRTVYLLSGGGEDSDWVKNMRREPAVTVRIAGQIFSGAARLTLEPQEESQARQMLAAKYQGWRKGRRLSEWASTALPVAIDLSD